VLYCHIQHYTPFIHFHYITYDGETDVGKGRNLTNPAHTYTVPGSSIAAGTYSVTLSVSGPCGSHALTRVGYITAQTGGTGNVAPLAYAGPDQSTDEGTPVKLYRHHYGHRHPHRAHGAVGLWRRHDGERHADANTHLRRQRDIYGDADGDGHDGFERGRCVGGIGGECGTEC